jgi:hypothetical protein
VLNHPRTPRLCCRFAAGVGLPGHPARALAPKQAAVGVHHLFSAGQSVTQKEKKKKHSQCPTTLPLNPKSSLHLSAIILSLCITPQQSANRTRSSWSGRASKTQTPEAAETGAVGPDARLARFSSFNSLWSSVCVFLSLPQGGFSLLGFPCPFPVSALADPASCCCR